MQVQSQKWLAGSNPWEKSPFSGLCNCVRQKWGHAIAYAGFIKYQSQAADLQNSVASL